MDGLIFREFQEQDEVSILRLNKEFVSVLSPMDSPRFQRLRKLSSLLRVAQLPCGFAGFLLAFKDRSEYDSPNYKWFARRFRRFLYIDRVVVDVAQRRRQIGSGLYSEARQLANSSSLHWMACEVNINPPNHESLMFHDRLGFFEVGQQVTPEGKTVSMRVCSTEIPLTTSTSIPSAS
jgi:predicted GNAT superfamily acetyltransferase